MSKKIKIVFDHPETGHKVSVLVNDYPKSYDEMGSEVTPYRSWRKMFNEAKHNDFILIPGFDGEIKKSAVRSPGMEIKKNKENNNYLVNTRWHNDPPTSEEYTYLLVGLQEWCKENWACKSIPYKFLNDALVKSAWNWKSERTDMLLEVGKEVFEKNREALVNDPILSKIK